MGIEQLSPSGISRVCSWLPVRPRHLKVACPCSFLSAEFIATAFCITVSSWQLFTEGGLLDDNESLVGIADQVGWNECALVASVLTLWFVRRPSSHQLAAF